jgi:hypothetical protein
MVTEEDGVTIVDMTVITSSDFESSVDDIEGRIMSSYASKRDPTVMILSDGKVEMNLGRALINLIVLRPIVDMGDIASSMNLLPTEVPFSQDILASHFNKILVRYEGEGKWEALNDSIAECQTRLAALSGHANVAAGNTVSVWSVIQAMEKNQALNDLVHLSIPDGMTFDEIEFFLEKEKMQELVSILKEEETCLRPYILSNTGINVKQMFQVICNIGLKPDLAGNVIGHAINTNFLRGLRDSKDYYVLSTGARKAQITNASDVKDSGYMTRKISLLVADVDLDASLDDCGTPHYMNIKIENQKTLLRLTGRRWLSEDGNLYSISETDDLIGSELMIRSPITCCAEKVCATCYGEAMALLNNDVHAGLFAMTVITSQLTQMLLSSKHLLQTRSRKVDWPVEMGDSRWTSIDRNMVVPNVFSQDFIVIGQDDLNESESGTSTLSTYRIKDKKTGKETQITSPVELRLSDSTERLVEELRNQSGESVIPLKAWGKVKKRSDEDMDNEEQICAFYFVAENRELSASLKGIKELIETREHMGLSDIHDIHNRMLGLLNESGIHIQSVHMEMILRAMTRDAHDQMRRPDFSEPDFPEYIVLRVADAIMNSPSVTPGLAFERIAAQLRDPSTFRKNGESVLDGIFLN